MSPCSCPVVPWISPSPGFSCVPQKYGRVLVVLPYVSIVNEKSQHLEDVLAPMHASVRGFCGADEKGQALAPRWVLRTKVHVLPCALSCRWWALQATCCFCCGP